MDQFEQLINMSLLKSLIKTQIDENVSNNINSINEKLKKIENNNLTNMVEIYGIHDNKLNNKKIRNSYIKKICNLLNLDYKNVLESTFDKNHISVKLNDAVRAKEWQAKSREHRLKNFNLNINFDGPIKIFVAATPEQKLLLKKTRDSLLPFYKYISICKNGIMVRRNEKSKVFIVRNEQHIEFLKFNQYYNFSSDNSVDSDLKIKDNNKKVLQHLI